MAGNDGHEIWVTALERSEKNTNARIDSLEMRLTEHITSHSLFSDNINRRIQIVESDLKQLDNNFKKLDYEEVRTALQMIKDVKDNLATMALSSSTLQNIDRKMDGFIASQAQLEKRVSSLESNNNAHTLDVVRAKKEKWDTIINLIIKLGRFALAAYISAFKLIETIQNLKPDESWHSGKIIILSLIIIAAIGPESLEVLGRMALKFKKNEK